MEDFFKNAMSLFENKDVWQKARYIFEYEASSASDDTQSVVLRLQGISDFPLIQLLRKTGADLSQATVTRCYSVVETAGQKEMHAIADIRNYRIFEDFPFVASGEPFDTNRESRTVILYIGYELHGQQAFTLVHFQPWGHRDTYATVMANVSVYTAVEGSDSRLSRCLLVFDEDTSLRVAEEFAQCQKTALEKLRSEQELTEKEELSLNVSRSMDYYWASAKSKMERNRWRDALLQLNQVYDICNQSAHEDFHKELAERLFLVASQIGFCHYRRGQYELAKSYLNFSEYDQVENPERQACLEACYNQLNRPSSSLLLERLFADILQVIPGELSDMLWVDNDTLDCDLISRQSEIWNFDLIAFMKQHHHASLYLSYNQRGKRLFEQTSDEASGAPIEDRSILNSNMSILIQLTRQEEIVRLSAVVPPGPLFDNNFCNVAKTVSLEFSLYDEWPTEQFHQLRVTAESKQEQGEELTYYEYYSMGRFPEVRKDFIMGSIAFNHHVFGDALVFLTRAYRSLTDCWNRMDFDEAERDLFGELSYMLGYIYTELEQYAYALHYLEALSRTNDSRWKIEYINALVNSKDIRAYSFVAQELEQMKANENPEEKEYLNFLKRRFGYLLIEFHELDEARTYFRSLLDDPDCREFAQRELDYIEHSF